MNVKKKAEKKYNYNFIILVFILIIALCFIVYLMTVTKKDNKANPLTTNAMLKYIDPEFTTTTQLILDNTITNEEEEEKKNYEEVSNFNIPLSSIISSLNFMFNYDITTYYHGVEFNFKCINFSEDDNECKEGSAVMKEKNVTIPLFTYNNDNDNYLNKADDYYIYFTDKIVILISGHKENSNGIIKVYDRSGNEKTTIDRVILNYNLNDNLYENIYPTLEDKNLYYYACINGNVSIGNLSLEDYSNNIIESVEGICIN